MAMSRLILIEGMIGAGKSTTAAHVAKWLIDQGEEVRAYHEFADDHPIRIEAVDTLRAAHPERIAPPDSGAHEPAPDPAVYAVEQWGALAERCRHGQRTIILESSFLQNSVLPNFTSGAPMDTTRAVFARIETLIAPAHPLLIYLRPSATEQAVKRVHNERGDPWRSWNVASVSNYPWARARGMSGQEAVIALYRAWEQVVDELLDLYSSPKLLLIDPQDDWEGALQRIYAKLRA